VNYIGILWHINLVFCLMSEGELFQYSVGRRMANYVGILSNSW